MECWLDDGKHRNPKSGSYAMPVMPVVIRPMAQTNWPKAVFDAAADAIRSFLTKRCTRTVLGSITP